MPHLRFDYSKGLEDHLSMPGLCAALRDALEETGLFPVGGIRVRGHAADCTAIADGHDDCLFCDIELRIGEGRSREDRERIVAAVYAAARAHMEPALQGRPVALSMELREIDATFSEKSWNTLHAAVAARHADDG